MGIVNKVTNKLFTEEDDNLFFEVDGKEENEKEEEKVGSYYPRTFADTEKIAKSLRSGNNVRVDLSSLDKASAMRMIDFLGGVMFAMNGDMSKEDKMIFIFKVKN